MRTFCLAGFAAAVALAWSGNAAAEGLGSVAVVGDCPSQELMKAALMRRQLPTQSAEYRFTLRSAAGGAEVSLADGTGDVVLKRRLDSEDCSALADAAALIVETFFVELLAREAAPQAAEPAPDSPGNPLGTPAAATPPVARAAPAAPAPAEPASPAPAKPAAPPSAPSGSRLLLALAAGLDWLPERGALGGAAEGVVGWSLVHAALDLELHATTGTTMTLLSGADRVSRLERLLTVRLDRRFGSRPVLAPWLGVGASAARLRLLALENGPTRTHWSPVLEAGVTAEQSLTGAWSVRAELGCRLLLLHESYRVNPGGEFGSGPFFGCGLLGGVSWSSGRR